MATKIAINLVITSPTVDFSGSLNSTFNGTFITNNTSFQTLTFTINTAKTASIGPTNLTTPIVPGPNFFELVVPYSVLTLPINPFTFGNMEFIFDDIPQTILSGIGWGGEFRNGTGGERSTNINCLHGASLIEMKDGRKRIDQIVVGDEIISGENLDEYVKVEGISHCWLGFNNIKHDAIIFETGSLGENEPSEKLIIDPGHPMCTQKEYLEKGFNELRPAGSYYEELRGDKVYTKKWIDESIQNDPSRRYDLILEEPYNIYIANGIVVRSFGYKDHRYGESV